MCCGRSRDEENEVDCGWRGAGAAVCTEMVLGQTQSGDGKYASLNGPVTLHRRVLIRDTEKEEREREREGKGSHVSMQSILHSVV
jgi:hypothetical protein